MTMTGIFGAPVENLAILLANCANFQTWCGAEDATEALTYIHRILDPEDADQTKRALITYIEGAWSASRQAMSSDPGSYDRTASLTLVFEQQSTAPQTDIEAFVSNVGTFIDDMMELNGTSSYMIISGFDLGAFTYDNETEHLLVDFTISWEI